MGRKNADKAYNKGEEVVHHFGKYAVACRAHANNCHIGIERTGGKHPENCIYCDQLRICCDQSNETTLFEI
jgi:hypothetical protein